MIITVYGTNLITDITNGVPPIFNARLSSARLLYL
jgi:hypothetical protein